MTASPVTTTDAAVAATPYRDRHRRKYLFALAVPLVPFLAGGLVAATGWSGFWWLGPILVFGIMPVLDRTLGSDHHNPPEEVAKDLDADRWYRYLTYAYLPLQFAGLVWATRLWAQGDLSLFATAGLVVTVGMVAGIAINTAHELGHKHPTIEQWLAKVSLAQSLYGHFFIEHNRGHHQHVSTPEDPASSRMGESFWTFLPRTVIGSLRSAIAIERTRSARLGRSFFSVRNDILNAWAMTVVLFGALTAVFGWAVLPLLIAQGIIGFCMLEIVNYIEHYGLLRGKKANGRYERCQPEHSWNAANVASNLVLYQLQRHSDHHANPTRRYQTLRHFADAPQLPTGYAGMMLLAAIPPLWRRSMDPRVVAHYDGDLDRINMRPRKRSAIEARYGSPTTTVAAV